MRDTLGPARRSEPPLRVAIVSAGERCFRFLILRHDGSVVEASAGRHSSRPAAHAAGLCGLLGRRQDRLALLHASWQRCRVHFMRNALAHAGHQGRRWSPPSSAPPSSKTTPKRRANNGVKSPISCAPKVPKLAALMDDAEADVLSFMTFPKDHRAKIHSINPLERLNGEIKRRTDVVGNLPQRGRHHPSDRRTAE
jgi:hypothetical protein